jgi:hypothetical protein
MELFSDSERFFELVLRLAEKNNDMSLSKLQDAYGQDKNVTLNFYMKLLESKSKFVSMPIAHILCGIGLKDLEKFYELFNLSNSNPEVKVGQIGALKMLSYKQRIADEAVKKVLAQSESCERSVRNAAIYFMLLAEIND